MKLTKTLQVLFTNVYCRNIWLNNLMFGYKSGIEKRVICSYVTCIKLIGFSKKKKLILILNYLVIKFNTTILIRKNKNILIYVYYTLDADKALSN